MAKSLTIARQSAHPRGLLGHIVARVMAGDCARVPYADASFDKAFSVHTLYFWPDLDVGLRELRRVLLDEGELLLAFHSSEDREVAANLPDRVYTLKSRAEVESAMATAGFHDVSVDIDGVSGLAIARARA